MNNNNDNKKSPFPILITEQCITVIVDNETFQIRKDHPNYLKVRQSIVDRDWENVKRYISIENTITKYSNENCKIVNGKIYYKGTEVHNLVVDRLFQFMNSGLPYENLFNFLNKLMDNPSMRARNELYNFLEHENLPIAEDGDFFAYKAIRSDYKDIWSGKVTYNIGDIVKMERAEVNDDCTIGCSQGLHAGSMDYVNGYGNSDSLIVLVKINPKNVVSVPSEDSRKLRTCELEVVKHMEFELSEPLYKNDGSSWNKTNNDNPFMSTSSHDYDDEDYEYDEDDDDEFWKSYNG